MMIFRRFVAAFALLCVAWLASPVEPAHANCTAPCTKAQINTDITTNWPDNTSGAITPALLRSTVLDLVNSYLDVNGSSSFTCSTHQFLTAIATLSTYTCAQPAFTDLSGANTAAQIAGSGASHAVPVDVAGTPTWKVVPDCQDSTGNHINYTQSTDAFSCGNTSSGTGSTITEPQGRLTLTANTPVMTATASAQTTLRYDCYIGGNVPYYTGSADALDTIASCEVTDAMVSAASAGQVVSGQVYDVWWVHGGANRICIAMSGATGGGGGWASDTAGSNTARGTGYSQLDRVTRGYTTNKNSIANCFNAATNYGPVSANQGTYLGTVTASANGQISWIIGGSASGGTAGVLGVWNMYNRVLTGAKVNDTGVAYTYTSATIQQARASAGNQITIVTGLAEDETSAYGVDELSTTANAGAFGSYYIGLDSTSTAVSPRAIVFTPAAAAMISQANPHYDAILLGLHVISLNQASDGTHANSFDSNSADVLALTLRM